MPIHGLIAAGPPAYIRQGSLLPQSIQVQQQQAPSHSHLAQAILYALQATDALNSQRDFARGGTEMDAGMRMIGGARPTALDMMGSFALSDLLRNVLLRHASQGTQNTAAGLQGLTNLTGILQTDHNLGASQGSGGGIVTPNRIVLPPVARP